MLHVTAEEAERHYTRRNMHARTTELYRRASRIIRRALREGRDGTLECLIASEPKDLRPRSALFAHVGLAGCPFADMPSQSDDIYYARRWRTYELRIGRTVLVLPRERLPATLREALLLGRATVETVPCEALAGVLVRHSGLAGASVRWVRMRPAAGAEAGFDLRVRLRSRAGNSEVRSFLPSACFPDARTMGRFVQDAIGTWARHI